MAHASRLLNDDGVNERVTRTRDERGIGIVTVMLLSVIVLAAATSWLQLANHQIEGSALGRTRTASFHAAEAAIHMAMSNLSVNPSYAGSGGLVTLADGASVLAQYEVTVNAVVGDPNARYIVARSYAPSATSPRRVARRLEQQVQLQPSDGFRFALFATSSGLVTQNNMTVTGDVYSQTNLALANYAKVTGDVVAPGWVTTSNSSTIGGDIRAGGDVVVADARTTVTGDVLSGGNVTVTGVVKGNVVAGGTIAAGGTVNGFRTPGSPPPAPPVLSLPSFSWNPLNYPSAQSWVSPATFLTYWDANKSSFGGAHRVLCPSPCTGSVDLDKSFTMNGDATIVSDSPIKISRIISTTATTPVTLTIVSLSSSSPAVQLTNNLVLPENIRVLIYSPNATVNFDNLKNFAGTVYAKGINIGQQFAISFAPVAAPGFAWDLASSTHFTIEVISFKEVPFS